MDPSHRVVPGASLALQVVHPGSPVLRVRYRQGVVVTPYGFPDWQVYARAIVALPRRLPGPPLTLDERRVVAVLAANELMAGGDDALWEAGRDDDVVATPQGWTWAHVGMTRQLALVPAELHGAWRHGGGISTMGGLDDPAGRRPGRGLRLDPAPAPVGFGADETAPEELLAALEAALGHVLPPAYRAFLAETNGGFPAGVGVHPRFGFVADQQLFGLGRRDRHHDIAYAPAWLRDRFVDEHLPIGYVQGGLLAVKVAGPDADSVWYWDDDDPRADDRHDAAYTCEHLLHRCADSIAALQEVLAAPAEELLDVVDALVDGGGVREERPELAGAGLPAAARAPWQSPPPKTQQDPFAALFDGG